MNWYKKIQSQFRPGPSIQDELPSIEQMIKGLGSSKGIDPNVLNSLIQDAENYLKMGHDAERVRTVMKQRLQAA